MHLTFGSTTSKDGRLTEVDSSDHTAAELQVLATERGVDGSGTKDQVAARLSAVVDFKPLTEPRVTTVSIPDGVSLSEAFATLTAAGGVIAYHADDVTWVDSDSPGLVALLAEHYDCEAGAPGDLEETHYTFNGPPGVDGSEQEDQS